MSTIRGGDDGTFKKFNSSIFQVVYLTISDIKEMAATRMYGAKTAFEDGILLLKHIYDKYGKGGSSNQVLKMYDII